MAGRTTCPYGAAHAVAAEPFLATELMLGRGGAFAYGRCETCGSLWLLDPPDDLASFYPDDYYSYASPEDPGVHPGFSRLMAALLRVPALARAGGRGPLGRTVFPFAGAWFGGLGIDQGAKILDVGSGGGATLARLRWLGFRDLTGIDPYLPASEAQVGPVSITRRSLAQVDEPYDVILFNHVLEHVADPVAELALAAERLRPGGHVVVLVPLADSEAFDRYGVHWAQLDAPRHLNLPTERAVRGAVGAAGLVVLDHWRDSHGFQFWGSEQYRQGIAMQDPRSLFHGPEHAVFSRRQVRRWEREARRLNREGRGDQGGFVLAPR